MMSQKSLRTSGSSLSIWAGVWETCLAPGWPQLRSRLPFGPRSQASLQKAQGPGARSLVTLMSVEGRKCWKG